jgi:hypothetical protein
MNNKVKVIINTVKYLKKIIKRLPKEEIDDEENKKLYKQYSELIDLIIGQIRGI